MKISSIEWSPKHQGSYTVTWRNGQVYHCTNETLFKIEGKPETVGIGLLPVIMLCIDMEVIECRHTNDAPWKNFKELYPHS